MQLRKLVQWATGGVVNPWTTPTTITPVGTTGMSGSFMIAAGAQIECQFNITAGEGSGFWSICASPNLQFMLWLNIKAQCRQVGTLAH